MRIGWQGATGDDILPNESVETNRRPAHPSAVAKIRTHWLRSTSRSARRSLTSALAPQAMTTRRREMSKTHRAMVVAVMEVLRAHDCISSYTIDAQSARPEWKGEGFERAFEEFKTNPQPFGLKKKNERAWLCILLAKRDKKTVDDFLIGGIKQRIGL